MTTAVRAAALAVVLLALSALAQDGPPADPDRGAKTRPAAAAPAGKKWAVVVGINYDEAGRKALARGDVGELRNAENDAKAVHALLTERFGYLKDETVLLLGAGATHEALATHLSGGGRLCRPEVTEADSVLVYFSGHGVMSRTQPGQPGRPFLLPFDVRKEQGNLVNGTALDLEEVVRCLREQCKARHKLLILDSCHSGGVFRLETEKGVRTEYDPDAAAGLAEPGFQALTASRESQTASDGRDGHSPFTTALLRALKQIPRQKTAGDGRFAAGELFATMKLYRDKGWGEQAPMCRWLTGDRGEFHFFPAGGAADEPAMDDRARRQLQAMVPSTFGNWWADEIPWFMPGLRHDVVAAVPESRSAHGYVTRNDLLEAVHRVRKEHGKARGGAAAAAGAGPAPGTGHRWRHLDLLLAASKRGAWDKAFEEVIADLEWRAALRHRFGFDPDPLDLHYLAVLKHKTGTTLDDFKSADGYYKRARAGYERLRGAKDWARPLEALCLLDHGLLELNQLRTDDTREAEELFESALELFRDRPAPKPFVAFVRCKMADACRRQGKFGLSDEYLDNALALAREWDPNQTHLLTAATYKQRAWACMEAWRIRQAKAEFEAAERALGDAAGRDEALVDKFHIAHGLAMVERFQGRPREALERYRRLTPEIDRAIRELADRRDQVRNYTELRQLLYERLVNSLERQADCNLFGADPDPAEAADDYRRAIRDCDLLAPDKVGATKKSLLYRRAVALLLVKAPDRDLELVRDLIQKADDIKVGEDDRLALDRGLAEALLHYFDAGEGSDRCGDGLCVLLEAFRRDGAGGQGRRGTDRDSMERLMFAHKFLLDHRRAGAGGKQKALEWAGQLLRLCRSAGNPADPDPALLRYLRPYFDTAFLAKKELIPAHAKELLEVAWEATHGTPYEKVPEAGAAVVAAFWAGGRCHLLVDAPGGLSQAFELPDVGSVDDLRRAGADPLPLPDAVRAVLRKLPAGRPLVYRWRDPVYGLGYEHSAARGQPAPAGGPAPDLKFPFDLRSAARQADVREEPLDPLRFRRGGPAAVAATVPPQAIPAAP